LTAGTWCDIIDVETGMAERIGDEMLQIECTVEHTTEKAWLVTDLMSGKQAWAPKSRCDIARERDAEGHVLMNVPEWWAKKQGFL
jgi:hypothetical protein